MTCNIFHPCRKNRLAQIVKKNSVGISAKAVVMALEKAEAFIRFANPVPSNLMDALSSQSFLDADTGRSYVVADILKSIVAGTIKIRQDVTTSGATLGATLEHVKKVAQNTPDLPFKKRKPPEAVVIAPSPKKDDDGWREMECIDNVGFEDYFDMGMTYLVTRSPNHPEDALIAVDRYGEEREVSFVRFQDANGFFM
jgi:hypothetical protein